MNSFSQKSDFKKASCAGAKVGFNLPHQGGPEQLYAHSQVMRPGAKVGFNLPHQGGPERYKENMNATWFSYYLKVLRV